MPLPHQTTRRHKAKPTHIALADETAPIQRRAIMLPGKVHTFVGNIYAINLSLGTKLQHTGYVGPSATTHIEHRPSGLPPHMRQAPFGQRGVKAIHPRKIIRPQNPLGRAVFCKILFIMHFLFIRPVFYDFTFSFHWEALE